MLQRPGHILMSHQAKHCRNGCARRLATAGGVGEEALKAEAKVVRSVIKNMKEKDQTLIDVTQEEKEKDRKLAVHPNYSLE